MVEENGMIGNGNKKKQKHHTVGPIPKSNIQTVERDQFNIGEYTALYCYLLLV